MLSANAFLSLITIAMDKPTVITYISLRHGTSTGS